MITNGILALFFQDDDDDDDGDDEDNGDDDDADVTTVIRNVTDASTVEGAGRRWRWKGALR